MADGFERLVADHREIEARFEEWAGARDGEVLRNLCERLTRHSQVELAALYPALRSAVEGGEELADGAEAEHMAVSTMVAEIYGSATPERLPDVVAQLREAVRTHVEEEETVLFPAMRDSKVDAGKLAADLAAAEDVHGSSS